MIYAKSKSQMHARGEDILSSEMSLDDDKVLVSFAIEKALLEFGIAALGEVTNRLFDYYHCEISDCFEKPEYLKKVLKDLYGNSYTVILESIKKTRKVLHDEFDKN